MTPKLPRGSSEHPDKHIEGLPRIRPDLFNTLDDAITGDILVCYGRGFVSGLISWMTPRWRFWVPAPSHVAILARHPRPRSDGVVPLTNWNTLDPSLPLWVHESTTLSKSKDGIDGEKRQGVQAKLYPDWINEYEGRVDLYTLNVIPPRPWAIVYYLLEVHRRKVDYDARGALHSASPVHNTENDKSLFCSELVAFALEKGGSLSVNASEQHPYNVTGWKCLDHANRMRLK